MKQINGNVSESLKNKEKGKNKQASAKNQLNLNIKNRKVENIKNTKQIPKKKNLKKLKTILYVSFQISGVSAIENSSLLNKTELSKNHDDSKSSKSKRLTSNSTEPDSMLSTDNVKHHN